MTITQTLTEFLTVSIAILKLAIIPTAIAILLFKIPNFEKWFMRVFRFKIEE